MKYITVIFLSVISLGGIHAQTQLTVTGTTLIIAASSATEDNITLTNSGTTLTIHNTIPDYLVNGTNLISGNGIVLQLVSTLTEVIIDGGDETKNTINVDLDYNFGAADFSILNVAEINQNNNLQTTSGHISLVSRGIIVINGNVETTSGDLTVYANETGYNSTFPTNPETAVSVRNGNGIFIPDGGSVRTVSGSIDLLGGNGTGGSAYAGVEINGVISSTGTGTVGNIRIRARGGISCNHSIGLNLESGEISSVDANIDILGFGGTQTLLADSRNWNDEGIRIYTSSINITGEGNITMEGTSTSEFFARVYAIHSQSDNPYGVSFYHSYITVAGGDIDITGTLSPETLSPNRREDGAGVFILYSVITTVEEGNITITGTGHTSPVGDDLRNGGGLYRSGGIVILGGTLEYSRLLTENGDITLTGYQSLKGENSTAVFLRIMIEIISSGTGNINLNCYANIKHIDNTSYNIGGALDLGLTGGTTVRTTTGDININVFDYNGTMGEINSIGEIGQWQCGGNLNINTSRSSDNATMHKGIWVSGDINFVCDDISFPNGGSFSFITPGSLTIRPKTPAKSIGLGDGATGDLQLNSSSLSNMSASQIYIGDASTGDIDMKMQTYSAPMHISGTNVIMDDVNTQSHPLTISTYNNGEIQENHTSSVVTASNFMVDGDLSPGGLGREGSFVVEGDVTFSGTATYMVELISKKSLHDHMKLLGASPTLFLNNDVLEISTAFYTPVADEEIIIIDVAGTNPVVGHFNGLPEGSTIEMDGDMYRISYLAGDGNDVSLTTNPSALPIELLHFSARLVDGSHVALEWQTATEVNNDYFTIERSQDGVDWAGIKMVDGSGTTTSAVSYATRDDAPLKGTSYYRLKQTDFNGDFSYSQVKSVHMVDQVTVPFQVYPNPTADRITIEGNEAELGQVRIYDMQGHDVTPMARAYTNNNTRVMIDLSELNAGMYCVKTRTMTKMVYKK